MASLPGPSRPCLRLSSRPSRLHGCANRTGLVSAASSVLGQLHVNSHPLPSSNLPLRSRDKAGGISQGATRSPPWVNLAAAGLHEAATVNTMPSWDCNTRDAPTFSGLGNSGLEWEGAAIRTSQTPSKQPIVGSHLQPCRQREATESTARASLHPRPGPQVRRMEGMDGRRARAACSLLT